MTKVLEQVATISAGDVANLAIDYTPYLDSGELLNGTPTAVELVTTDLDAMTGNVSTAELLILGETVAIGKAVQFAVSGQVEGVTYQVKVTATTDASQTINVEATIVTV